ncbi:16S rRNA (adenine(1518)-N(6)/adenine(1519)-N(6))-dimethyltransferase RsmA [Polynucleobacter sp. JS-Safj-400b-B2]|jgi:16S rRNA (adenine1518-N6/adenine1519-N6)-dimethyltransferase|uniref:16S rRNA (adenine(1518)-N(6)/adenine(1519)-N(6))- dimethyltransferase RsmA n=1 Tax=Polynucleobacter sp. JS-Safj-400b-B2 TaxID=2576921 RepID=UPI001C0BB7CD|nr:16S rRNA (adenine(1518)-N(6)/adenine(1519)-N(6))-dimethyltransferase RsmA [Polynucleobacter sp. JS-Safj-400b-B2]MBU3625405.1 16S rRNA (adenine(1518)-N(6)/adenine(1519)-N(6))-dimethyltransferase RsmA [Polynucleobacter sp. JS-Safj-400b-B2]
MHRARKRFGQNFLQDNGIIYSIVALINPGSDMHVIEIGPGLGALTLPLLNNLDHLDLLEIDRDLVAFWNEKSLEGLTVIEGDALKFDFLAWAQNRADKQGLCKVVGNLPYNISSPLLFHLVAAASHIDEQVFMLQAEVVERMVAKAGGSDFSRLSVMLQARYDMELVLEVPPEAFDPQPKVNSAVVRMIPRRDFALSNAQWSSLEKVVAAAFSQRRKMLRTNLSAFADRLSLTETELKARAQDISVDRYIEWAKVLAS